MTRVSSSATSDRWVPEAHPVITWSREAGRSPSWVWSAVGRRTGRQSSRRSSPRWLNRFPTSPPLSPAGLRTFPALPWRTSMKKCFGRQISPASRWSLCSLFSSSGEWGAGAVFSKLHKDYSARGLQVLGVNLYDKDASIQEYIQKYRVKVPGAARLTGPRSRLGSVRPAVGPCSS